MSTRAASAQAIATHGVVDIAALDATPKESCGVGEMRVDVGSAKVEMASVDEVAVGEAQIQVDWDGVQLSPRVPALEHNNHHLHAQSYFLLPWPCFSGAATTPTLSVNV
jgi:hypothetical protein